MGLPGGPTVGCRVMKATREPGTTSLLNNKEQLKEEEAIKSQIT